MFALHLYGDIALRVNEGHWYVSNGVLNMLLACFGFVLLRAFQFRFEIPHSSSFDFIKRFRV